MEHVFQAFLRAFRTATRLVAADYFRLTYASDFSPDVASKYLERVYCYELYHQLRLAMSAEDVLTSFVINGEIDKTHHPFIDGENQPDLLVHKPGTMKQNLVVIEVKTADQQSKIGGDLSKLIAMTKSPTNYFRGIQLVFGNNSRTQHTATSKYRDNVPEYRRQHILLYHHAQQGQEAQLITPTDSVVT